MKNIITIITAIVNLFVDIVCSMLDGTRFVELSTYISNTLKKEDINCPSDVLSILASGLTKIQNRIKRTLRLYSRHMTINILDFDKPVAFYAYTSMAVSQIYYIDTWDDITRGEREIVDYIDMLMEKANKANRRNDYCSTRYDNKTVIAMKDSAGCILYFGEYDGRYTVGLGVWTEFNDGSQIIDLTNAW